VNRTAAADQRQHPPALGFLALVGLAVLLSLVGGCTRETAKAAKQADQAVAAIAIKADTARAEIAKPEPDRTVIAAALDDVAVLSGAARTSLAPTVRLLEAESWTGSTTPDTTPADAFQHPPAFAQRAAIQAGRAGLEADRAEAIHATVTAIAPVAGGLGSQVLAALGGASGAGAIALWIGRTLVGRYRSALKTTAQLADDLESAETEDQVDAAKTKALAAQLAAGNRPLVQAVRGKA
jgi:hypothetical protein